MIDRLVSVFLKFPGIGLRQARRFVYHLLLAEPRYIEEFIFLLQNLKKETKQCTRCFRFFEDQSRQSRDESEKPEKNECSLCVKNVNSSILIIVEKDIDLENIQKGNAFHGTYFVLGGLVSSLNKESSARIASLVARLKKDAPTKKLEEVIIALSAHPNGDYTTTYIKNIIAPIAKKHGIKISTLGRGMSTGTELEYSDSETIRQALENRR
ncbi:MAG: recombination protein RecR [Parcubacteria group bacterium]|nr:recombination protein RecR [Parcubacteria group bacterium]